MKKIVLLAIQMASAFVAFIGLLMFVVASEIKVI